MDKLTYEKLMEANNRAEAEIIESFLELHGIDVELVEESVSHTSLVISAVRVDVFVPIVKLMEARALLNSPIEMSSDTTEDSSQLE